MTFRRWYENDRWGSSSRLVAGDGKAECLRLTEKASLLRLPVSALEVVDAEVLVRLPQEEQMVGNDQNAMADGDRCPLSPFPSDQPAVLSP